MLTMHPARRRDYGGVGDGARGSGRFNGGGGPGGGGGRPSHPPPLSEVDDPRNTQPR